MTVRSSVFHVFKSYCIQHLIVDLHSTLYKKIVGQYHPPSAFMFTLIRTATICFVDKNKVRDFVMSRSN
jgi:hypothetical protein